MLAAASGTEARLFGTKDVAKQPRRRLGSHALSLTYFLLSIVQQVLRGLFNAP